MIPLSFFNKKPTALLKFEWVKVLSHTRVVVPLKTSFKKTEASLINISVRAD
jgi:hypothetical protein